MCQFLLGIWIQCLHAIYTYTNNMWQRVSPLISVTNPDNNRHHNDFLRSSHFYIKCLAANTLRSSLEYKPSSSNGRRDLVVYYYFQNPFLFTLFLILLELRFCLCHAA